MSIQDFLVDHSVEYTIVGLVTFLYFCIEKFRFARCFENSALIDAAQLDAVPGFRQFRKNVLLSRFYIVDFVINMLAAIVAIFLAIFICQIIVILKIALSSVSIFVMLLVAVYILGGFYFGIDAFESLNRAKLHAKR